MTTLDAFFLYFGTIMTLVNFVCLCIINANLRGLK